MSYTNGTTHYNLPLTTGSDKRDWSDTNQSFSDVDAALYGAVQDTAQAELDIDALETRMDTAEQNIATNTGDISGLDTRVTTVEGAVTSLSGQVTDTRQDLEDMICAFNEASATSTHAYEIGDYFIYNDVLYRATQSIAIGDTIVPDTNCTTTNVTTELLSINVSNFVNTDVVCLFIEDSTTSSHNYSIGDYFILNNSLYVVTAPITIGDAISVGTNCNTSTLTGEILSVKAEISSTKPRLLGTRTFTTSNTFGDAATWVWSLLSGYSDAELSRVSVNSKLGGFHFGRIDGDSRSVEGVIVDSTYGVLAVHQIYKSGTWWNLVAGQTVSNLTNTNFASDITISVFI